MPTIVEAQIAGSGSITYQTAVAPKPATSETTKSGNVTVNNINTAQPGIPAQYEVSFMIQATVEEGGIKAYNTFHWNSIVIEQDDRAQYRSVEDRAAKNLAPMLRALADRIEADLPKFENPPTEA